MNKARDQDLARRCKYNECGKSRDISGDRSREPRVKLRVETKVANKEKRKVIRVHNRLFVIYCHYLCVSMQTNERNE